MSAAASVTEPMTTAAQVFAAARSTSACELQRLWQAGVDINARDQQGCTALRLAAAAGDAGAVKLLLAAGADLSWAELDNPLSDAVVRNRVKVVKVLLSAGPDPHHIILPSSHPITGRKLATSCLHIAAFAGCSAVVQALLDAGFDPRLEDDNGCIPLAFATSQQRVEVVRLLLSAGATVTSACLSDVVSGAAQLAAAGAASPSHPDESAVGQSQSLLIAQPATGMPSSSTPTPGRSTNMPLLQLLVQAADSSVVADSLVDAASKG